MLNQLVNRNKAHILCYKVQDNKKKPLLMDFIDPIRDHAPNTSDFKNIEKNIKTYFEFPKLSDMIETDLEISKDELDSSNHLTYIELY